MTIERRIGSGRIRITEVLSNLLGVPPGRMGKKVEKPARSELDPIALTPSRREMVEMRIAEIIQGSTSFAAHAREAIIRTHALPLLFDWDDFFALRPEGHVVQIPYDDQSGEYEFVHDERLRNVALYQGTKLHPGLSFLLPARLTDASECPDCRGTGRLIFPQGHEHLSEKIICYCGGLGWLPHDRKP